MTWEVLTGVIEWWSDEGIRDLGRFRFHESHGFHPTGSLFLKGTISIRRSAFVARRRPWRMAQIMLEPTEEDDAAVVAWADEATAVLIGQPASLSHDRSWGDLGLRRMLEPEPLETFVPRPWEARIEIEGSLLDNDVSILPEFVSLASDRYEATYDSELDILTSWSAFIDDELACRQKLSEVVSVG